jgi:hypothetical protein
VLGGVICAGVAVPLVADADAVVDAAFVRRMYGGFTSACEKSNRLVLLPLSFLLTVAARLIRKRRGLSGDFGLSPAHCKKLKAGLRVLCLGACHPRLATEPSTSASASTS